MERSVTHEDEEQLLVRLREGNAGAFTQLYHQYSERLYYNILSLVKDEMAAEELLQEIFVTVWKKKETLHIRSSFAGYLFRVSRNKVYDFFKNLNREQELYRHIKAIATEHYSHVEESIFRRENACLLEKALEVLPPKRRQVFQLCKIEGRSYKEAGELMGVSVSTVKDHMARAREAVREYLMKNGEFMLGVFLLSGFMTGR